jgi:membrane protein DedA with SNARE-associated domain
MFSLISALLARYGLGAVAGLMLVENLVPLIPSELILPFVGFEAARGQTPFALALAVATVASTAGGLAWYGLGRRLGFERTAGWAERHGAWTTLNRKDIEMGCRWFRRWGGWAVMVGRALPGIRSFIPVPAGVAGQGVFGFLAWSGLGALAWSALLMALGFLLQSHYAAAKRWLDPVLDGLIALALLAYVFRLLRCRRLRKAAARAVGAT